MANEQTIQQVEMDIEVAKEYVAFGEAIDRLVRNKDFQAVIDKGYMTDEVRRLTFLSADSQLEEATRAKVLISIQAIGEFHQYLRVRKMMAEQARGSIAEYEEALDHMRSDESQGADE